MSIDIANYVRKWCHMPSVMSRILYWILKKSNLNQRLRLEINQNRLDQHPKEKPSLHMIKKYHIETSAVSGQLIYQWSKHPQRSQNAIFYIHGGAYVHGLSGMHYRFLESLIKQTGFDIILPDYPLVPDAKAEEIYAFLKDSYHEKMSYYQKVIIMGDSAGGGLALGLAQQLTNEGYRHKYHLMLLSPWLDVSMELPDIHVIQDEDPILNAETLKMVGEMFAKGHSIQDPLISPLYGEFIGIESIALWIGTRDILYADAKALQDKIKHTDIDFKMFVYPQMLHTWMFFGIKESNESVHEMVSYIHKIA